MGKSANAFTIKALTAAAALTALPGMIDAVSAGDDMVIVGGTGATCLEDQQCINRFHPDIPMEARAKPGQTILFKTRDAADVLGIRGQQAEALPSPLPIDFGRIHAVTGPVYIEGAKAGDTLAVTIKDIKTGTHGWTSAGSFGFGADLSPGEILVTWELKDGYATSPDLPGIKIPDGSFPGIVATLPSHTQNEAILTREQALHTAGGSVFLPDSDKASPADICGPDGSDASDCLRTIPPREHGGNMDIRYLSRGVTIYLPCNIDGCGLGIGDLHFAQGDGEVGGAAIEMSADVWVTTEILKDGPDLTHGPHYSGPARLMNIPSENFYAVTGFPLKEAGSEQPRQAYLNSGISGPLTNLSNDINLAARNALDGMIDHIVAEYGYTRLQAYLIASIAVDMRIAQLVDTPNVGVTALLPLDIFEKGQLP